MSIVSWSLDEYTLVQILKENEKRVITETTICERNVVSIDWYFRLWSIYKHLFYGTRWFVVVFR